MRGNRERIRREQRLDDRAALESLLLRSATLANAPREVGAQLRERREARDVLGELVVQRGNLAALQRYELHLEANHLPAQRLVGVVLGHRDVEGALVPDLHAHELILEATERAPAADLALSLARAR